MTEQAAGSPAGKTPQVQPGVKADTPRDTATDPKAAPDPYGEARLLRAQAAALEATAPPGDEWVKLKVEPPHASFGYGGVTVGDEWTPVHVSLAPGVLRAASAAGVTVTQQEGQ
jgi:hypothetical protein